MSDSASKSVRARTVEPKADSIQCYCFSFLLGFTESWISDKYNKRAHILLFNCFLEIIGIAVLGFAQQPYVRYFGAFLVTGGVNANVPASMTYQANNIVGQWKRAFASATMVAAGGIGGIIGVTVFRSQDAPEYVPGLVTCFLAVGVVIMSVTTTTIYFIVQNRKQAKEGKILEGVQGFRYTL